MKIPSNKLLKVVENKTFRNTVSQLARPGALLPIALVESSCILGRTYQAHKRGGWVESRERATEEVATAVIWLWGIKSLNKIFNKILEKNGFKEILVDTGKDVIRDPLAYALKFKEHIKNKLTALKTGKILLSTILGVTACGFVLPKLNQKITRFMAKEDNKIASSGKTAKSSQNNFISFSKRVTMKDFLSSTRNKSVSFTNGSSVSNFLSYASHNLENNNIWNLFSIDLGLWTGRTINGRNEDEKVEILFREMASCYFFLKGTQHVYKFLSQKIDKFKGKNTDLDNITAEFVNRKIERTLFKELKSKGITIQDFKNKILGTDNYLTDNYKNIMEEVPNAEIIDRTKFENIVKKHAQDSEVTSILAKIDDVMKKRPAGASTEVLTASEVDNCLKSGLLNEADFNKCIAHFSTKGKSSDSKKFISYKEIEQIKKQVNDYVETIIKMADGDKITQSVLDKAKVRNSLFKLGYMGTGLAVSMLFISTIIPKIQYYITEKRTGKKEFPGVRGLNLKQ